MRTLGNKIKLRRIELNMSQEELAEKIESKKSYISKLEKNKITNLHGKTIRKLAKALRVPLNFFLHEIPIDVDYDLYERITTYAEENGISVEKALQEAINALIQNSS